MTDDGGFLLTSASNSGPTGDKSNSNRGDHDIWAIKLDANGNRNHYASDPEGDNFTWSISGGGDASYFEINATTGEITFAGADYENPQDADHNNTYEVTIRATDSSGLYDEQSISIEVEDVYEPSRVNHVVDLNSTVSLEMIWVEPYFYDGQSYH